MEPLNLYESTRLDTCEVSLMRVIGRMNTVLAGFAFAFIVLLIAIISTVLWFCYAEERGFKNLGNDFEDLLKLKSD
jgi:hypothetical protein